VLGHRLGQAEALNRLGELSSCTSASHQARERHTQALSIARDIGVHFEEARTLEGLGRAHLQDGNTGQAAAHLGRPSASTSARDLPGLRAFRTHFATAVCDGEARSQRRRAPRSPDQVIGEPDSAHNWADLAARARGNEASTTRADSI
jgi:hypothetical protein